MSKPVIQSLVGMRSLLLLLAWVVVICSLLLSGQTLVAMVLVAVGCVVLIWLSTRYQKMLVTVHRKWHSSQPMATSPGAAHAKTHQGRQEFHLATSHGEAIVTKRVYDRIDEGHALTVIGTVADGNIHVVWPLF